MPPQDDITEIIQILQGIGHSLRGYSNSADVQECLKGIDYAVDNLQKYKASVGQYIPQSPREPVLVRLFRWIYPKR